MNDKLLLLFMICFASLLVMGSVNANSMHSHNFDDYFEMDVPNGVTFQTDDQSNYDGGFSGIFVSYLSENLGVMYYDSPEVSENSSTWFYQTIFEGACPDLDGCYETQEDNIVILQPKKIDEMHYPIVGVCSGNKIVILTGNDLNTLKQMAHSVKFK